MVIDRSEDRGFIEILASQVAEAENSEQIVSLLILRFRMISDALGPVIGHGGVTALFERSLYIVGDRYAWIQDLRIHANTGKAFSSIAPVFALRTMQEAADAAVLIVSEFCDLLAGMVGYSLSERLLRPVLGRSMSDSVVKGNSDE
jgi:hypothetical protein